MATKYPEFRMPEGPYAGDVSALEAWQRLSRDPGAILVDVRTQVEWSLIGKPDLSSMGREPIYVQWMTAAGPNADFLANLKAALETRKAGADTPIFFLCQSGGRSKVSAIQCTALGYSACYNIAEGFEGALDEHKHRNSVNGWKVAGLPWTQT
jgi:rhodanese-related sulfurtransferase